MERCKDCGTLVAVVNYRPELVYDLDSGRYLPNPDYNLYRCGCGNTWRPGESPLNMKEEEKNVHC